MRRAGPTALAALALILLATPTTADPKRSPPAWVGAVSLDSPEIDGHLVAALRQRLGELGWIDGRTMTLELRFAGGRFERIPDLVAELLHLPVRVIFAGGDPVAAALRRAGSPVPVVFVGVNDPVGAGFVASLARPGGNMTGVTAMAVELNAKRLELLKEAIPTATRIGVLGNPGNALYARMAREVAAAARALRVQVTPYPVTQSADLEEAVSAMARDRQQALLVLPDGLFFTQRARLAELAARHRLPSMCVRSEYVRDGCLLAYSTSLLDQVRRGAELVDRVLRGAKPTDIPVEQPTRFDLAINRATARGLGLRIPPSVLDRADEVFD